jgi:hypothetical protein
VLPCLLLWDLLLGFTLWKTGLVEYTLPDIISLKAAPLLWVLITLAKGITWISTYFASFVIVGEVSDVCLGGTASFSKAIYKASVRGVGRLLGTDILYLFVLSVAVTITFILSHFVIEPWVGGNSARDFATRVPLYILSLSLPTWLFLFTAQVVAIERKYWLWALARSASIAWRSKKQSLAIFALFGCSAIIYQVVGFLVLYLLDDVIDLSLNVSLWVGHSIMGIVWLLYVPITSIFLTLAYYHLRRIQGELSVELLTDIKAYEMS